MAGKSNLEVLQALFDKLQLCQRALGKAYNSEQQLVDATLRAVGGVRELSLALTRPEKSFEALCATLRSTLRIAENARTTEDTFLVDRRFQQSRERRSGLAKSSQRFQQGQQKSNSPRKWTGKCWVCTRTGCYSTNHSAEDQAKAKERWKRERAFIGRPKETYGAYLAEYERPILEAAFVQTEGSEESEEDSRDQSELSDSSDDDPERS